MNLHVFLDLAYGENGAAVLRAKLRGGTDPNEHYGPLSETPLHVAARRRRADAVDILLEHGAKIDAMTRGGKTAYAHAIRRGFDDVVGVLERRGASTTLNDADRLAVAVVCGHLDEARALVDQNAHVARTGNPEEDRLLADVAGRPGVEAVDFLIQAGADLAATGLDSGTPLHQAAWFGQPANARRLIDAGAPLDVFDATHESSPLGWAVHGSRYSGGAAERQVEYAALVDMLAAAGSSLRYPGDDTFRYYERLCTDATDEVRAVLERYRT